jgi:hypothetical protein
MPVRRAAGGSGDPGTGPRAPAAGRCGASCWAELCRHHRYTADDDGDGRPLSDGKLLIVFVIAAVLVACIVALGMRLIPQL